VRYRPRPDGEDDSHGEHQKARHRYGQDRTDGIDGWPCDEGAERQRESLHGRARCEN
jgi:hypothetical protein